MDAYLQESELYESTLGLTPPEEVKQLTDDRQAGHSASKEVRNALRAHVISPPDNVYIPTDSPETLNFNGQKITFEVRKRTTTVNGKEHEVAETIVEPKDPTNIKETHIVLGGYSINTPHYYQNFIPFAVSGIRFVFINLLGGGTEEYVNRPKRISLLGGKTSVDNDYLPEAAKQISTLIDEFKDHPVVLEGYSVGGLIVSKSLARPDLLSGEHVKRISGINLDAPVPTGPMPFGGGMHLLKLISTSLAHRFAGVLGACSSMSKDFIGDTMMPSTQKISRENDENNRFKIQADRVIKEVSEACFKATGVFPEVAFNLRQDPLARMAQDEAFQEHRDLVRGIPIKVIFRPGDKIVPAEEIIDMVKRWRAFGYNARLIEAKYQTNSHMDLPSSNYTMTWLNGHGQAGRVTPKPTNHVLSISRRPSRSQGSPSLPQAPQSI